jgi:hypothetical protein
LNYYFDRIDQLGNEAEDLAAEIPLEATAEEIDADRELSVKVERYMVCLEWIEALEQETKRGKPMAFENNIT